MSRAYSVDKLRRATIHFIGGRAVQALARAALVLVVVRLLPAADYGAYMLVVGLAEMLPQLCSFGLLPVGQRYLPQLVESAPTRSTRRFLWVISGLQLLALVAVCALLWLFWGDLLPHMGFTQSQIEASRPAIALLLLTPAFRFVTELMQALLQQGRAQIAATLSPLGRCLGILVLLIIGVEVTLTTVVLLDIGIVLGCLLLAWAFLLHGLHGLEEPDDPRPLPVRDMVRHGWHMAVAQLMGASHTPGALRMAVANSLGIVESGLFAFLQALQRLVGRYLPGELLRPLVRPMLISRAQSAGGMTRVEHGVDLLFKTNLLMVSAGAVAVTVGGDRLVEVASGGKFLQAGDALLLMFLTLVFRSQRMVIDMVLQILDLTRVLRATSLLLPVTLLAVWLAAGWGLNAAIIASGAGMAAANAFCMWVLRARTGRFHVDWRGSGSLVLTAVVAALAGIALEDVVGTWLAMLVALMLHGVLMLAAKPFAAGELMVVERVLGGLGRRLMQPLARKVPA